MSKSLASRLLISIAVVTGAPGALAAQGQASLALEVNRYYGDHDRTLVEGAVEVPYTLMTFTSGGESLQANAKVEVVIAKTDGEQVYHTERDIRPEAVNAAMAKSDRVSTIETFAIYAPPGDYVATGRITDLTSQQSYEMTIPLVVPANRPFFSDVLLSNRVLKNVQLEEGSYLPYLIGTTMFNPNPRHVFYKDSPLLYFYYEINPEAVGGEGGTHELEMFVAGANGEIVKRLGERAIKVGEDRNFDLGAFNIAGLLPGEYVLQVRCSTCEDGAQLDAGFEVGEPLDQLALNQMLGTPEPTGSPAPKYYAEFTPAQVDSVVKVMDVWFSTQQRQLLKTLNNDGKIGFLNRFWASLDADPSIGDPDTEENEPKVVFEQRVAYADEVFSSSQRLGRDNDRGQVYILYGEPTERFDRPYEATVGPYEIWNYTGQGDTFAFGDFSRDGRYRLIYSTNRQFVGDPNIQTQVDGGQVSVRQTTIPLGRGYETIIEDILTNRITTRSFQR
jgi:GWxTD domain-containing protein